MPFSIRQIARFAKVTLDVCVEPVGPATEGRDALDPKFKVTMTSVLSGLGFIGAAPLRAVGIPTTKTDVRFLDDSEFEQEEPIVGKFVTRMSLCTVADLAGEGLDEFLTKDYATGDPGAYVIRWKMKSIKAGEPNPWSGDQLWGILDGRWVGRMSMGKGAGDKREVATCTLVYEYHS